MRFPILRHPSAKPTGPGWLGAVLLALGSVAAVQGAPAPEAAVKPSASIAPAAGDAGEKNRAEQKPDPAKIDKGGYNLFNPVPVALMREFSHDRPDVNDTPHTVDAGHFQVEMDIAAYTYDRHNVGKTPIRVTTWEVAPMLIKVGVLNWADLQLGISPYTDIVAINHVTGARTASRGFGDSVLRAKLNLWGNDGGDTAFALIPYIKAPTAQDDLGNRKWEGGVSLPFEMELPAGFDFGVMPILSALGNDSGPGRDFQYGGALVIGHKIAGPVDGLVEFIGQERTQRGAQWEGMLNLALTWAISENLHLDCGIKFGLTRSADDLRPAVGLSWRY
jgi:Putative MetA-pathway of phenol degradation